jgi:serine protease Do
LIESVTTDGPAAKAGLKEGDIILRFDGKEVPTNRALPKAVARTQHGKEVDIEILRQGKRQVLKIVVGRLQEDDDKKPVANKPGNTPPGSNPTETPKGATPPPAASGDAAKQLSTSLPGLKLAPLDDQLRRQYGIDAKVKGILVTEADPASASGQKGVKAGDVIVEVAQDPANTLDDMVKSIDKVKKAGRKAVLLRIENAKGEMRFEAVQLP